MLAQISMPAGIRSRTIEGVNGLDMHVFEAGHEGGARQLVLLLHGFPELAYSWRKLMLPLANAGFHVVAPDQRGYGRTVGRNAGWEASYDGDLTPFRLLNLVRDAVGLVAALGYKSVAMLVGHDFGSPVAAWCALVRPDIFQSVALMSAPFGGPPPLPPRKVADPIHDDLAALARPRKHYQWYYSTREANDNMLRCKQGVHDFLRAYYHHKSADWKANKPHVLASWSAAEVAKMPAYYIMDLGKGMAETVAPEMPSAAEIAANTWLPEDELRVYSTEYARTGFQGGLQWYRCGTTGAFNAELEMFHGRTIDVPSCFIAGRSDWGPYQRSGDPEQILRKSCTQFRGFHRVEGAGHWVQQEQPGETSRLLLDFIKSQR